MNDSARSSISKVTSPPPSEPSCAPRTCPRPSWRPSSGRTSSRSASASSLATPASELRSFISALRSLLGALAELDLELLGLAVAQDLDHDRVPGPVPGDGLGEIALRDHLLPVHGDDHVPSASHLLALEAEVLVTRFDPRLVGRAVGDDLRDERAGRRVDLESLRELRVQRMRGHAEARVVGL